MVHRSYCGSPSRGLRSTAGKWQVQGAAVVTQSPSRRIQQILTAACIAAGLFLAGCDAAADANRAAQRTSEEAAKRSLSAGDPRATDVDALVASLKSKAGATGILVQNTADKDLADAINKLKEGIALDPSPVVK